MRKCLTCLFLVFYFIARSDANFASFQVATLFDGSWTTITCNGTSADDTAWNAWKSTSVAANPALAKLHVAGGACNIGSAVRLIEGITNFQVVFTGGATVSQAYIGGSEFYYDNTHSAKIQTVSAGASQVTLVTAGEDSRFSVGDWICIGGYSTQQAGAPPNFQFFEFKTVLAKPSSGVITLSSTLAYGYKSTWPVVDVGSVSELPTGPGTIYKMQPDWSSTGTITGLHVIGGGSVGFKGLNLTLINTIIAPGIVMAPTASVNMIFNGLTFEFMEVDKEMVNFTISNATGQIQFQSSSVTNSIINNFIGTASPVISLLGTGLNTTITNSTIPLMRAGPTSFGQGGTLVATNNTITTADPSDISLLISDVASLYSGGAFVVPRVSAFWQDFLRWGAPGTSHYFGDGSARNNSSPHTTFIITDVSDDGTNTTFTTSPNIASSLSSIPTCGVPACTKIVAFQAQVITQSSSGPADLTGFAP